MTCSKTKLQYSLADLLTVFLLSCTYIATFVQIVQGLEAREQRKALILGGLLTGLFVFASWMRRKISRAKLGKRRISFLLPLPLNSLLTFAFLTVVARAVLGEGRVLDGSEMVVWCVFLTATFKVFFYRRVYLGDAGLLHWSPAVFPWSELQTHLDQSSVSWKLGIDHLKYNAKTLRVSVLPEQQETLLSILKSRVVAHDAPQPAK